MSRGEEKGPVINVVVTAFSAAAAVLGSAPNVSWPSCTAEEEATPKLCMKYGNQIWNEQTEGKRQRQREKKFPFFLPFPFQLLSVAAAAALVSL